MIKTPTALILGAGASKPFGFPTGHELKESIVANIRPQVNSTLRNSLRDLGIPEDEVHSFFAALKDSGRSSVDAFLEYRTEFLKVGKYAIALSLMPYEEHHRLFQFDGKAADWYEYLFNKTNTSFEMFDHNELYIITFNYDRSLEYYLFTALKNSFNMSEEKCAEKMKGMPIIHVYGALCALPWQGGISRPYMPGLSPDNVKNASDQILIMSECSYKSEQFERAYQILYKVKRIYFLGFGYGEANLERLGLSSLPSKYMAGTALGLEDAETTPINRSLGIQFPDNNSDVLQFLKKHGPLD